MSATLSGLPVELLTIIIAHLDSSQDKKQHFDVKGDNGKTYHVYKDGTHSKA